MRPVICPSLPPLLLSAVSFAWPEELNIWQPAWIWQNPRRPNQLVLQPLDLQELQFLNLARLAYAATSACLQEA